MKEVLLKHRLVLILITNLILTSASFFIALGLRFEFDWTYILHSVDYLLPLLLLMTFRQATYSYFSLNQGYWRFASMRDLQTIFKAHLISSAFWAAGILAFRISFPRSVIIGEFVISIFIFGGSRFVVRSLNEFLTIRSRRRGGGEIRETVVLGGGNSGHLLVKLLTTAGHLPYFPAAVLDDSERLKDTAIHGVKVKGTLARLDELLAENSNISSVICAIPSLSYPRIEELKAICDSHSVLFKKLQSFEDIACLDANDGIDKLNIESLLDCEVRVDHENEICAELMNRRILVTGAGGSIGSELVRQIIQFKPKELILLDNCEYNMFRLLNELRVEDVKIRPRLADICDRQRLAAVFAESMPEWVYHAAAYKHVPLMEENCYEAYKNNVKGTKTVLEVANSFGAKRFVLISTDKAVDPSSVMGATKKIAELLLQNSYGKMQTAAVRFGNVINSTGSVIPLFRDQIARGGPITVTHPNMERYFMSIREAVRLVLTAGTLGKSGEIYILDMGERIRIVDVAKKMLSLYGRRDIEIVFTGARPGEKITEDLLAVYERSEPTSLRKVNKLHSKLLVGEEFANSLSEIESRIDKIPDHEIGNELKQFIARLEAPFIAQSAAAA